MIPPEVPDVYSSLQKWVDRLVLDIGSRGLRSGDVYLTTEEAGKLLGCSRATAYRAMKHLMEKGVLLARPGSGTFVGSAVQPANVQAKSIHVLMPLGFEASAAMPLIRLMQLVASSLGGWGVNFDTFPHNSGLDYVQESLLKPYHSGRVGAVVAISCHWTVHRLLKEQGINAVVLGSMFSDQQYLPSIDKDSAQGGRLLVEHLLRKKYRNFIVLALASGLAGVDLFTDSISRTLSTHGVSADSLTLRSCNGDEPVTVARLRELLSAATEPTAIIADEEDLANLAASAVAAAGLILHKDVEVVFQGTLFRSGAPAPYLHSHVTIGQEDLAAKIVAMIQSPKSGDPAELKPLFIPVRLADKVKSETKTYFST